jgi:hypothetical protein
MLLEDARVRSCVRACVSESVRECVSACEKKMTLHYFANDDECAYGVGG